MNAAHQKVRDVPNLRNPTGPSNRLLPSSFPGLLRSPAPAQNPTKIGPKSDHSKFINASAQAVYDFYRRRRSDFRRHGGFPVSQAPAKQNQYKTCTFLVQKGGGGVQVFRN